MSCYEGMRAALRRNIEGLSHLSAEEKEALLETECSAAIAATEAGRPLVEIYGPEEVHKVLDENDEAPTQIRSKKKSTSQTKLR